MLAAGGEICLSRNLKPQKSRHPDGGARVGLTVRGAGRFIRRLDGVLPERIQYPAYAGGE